MMVVEPSTWQSDVLVLRALQPSLVGDRDRQRRLLDLVGNDLHVGRGEEAPDRLAQSGDAQHRDPAQGQQGRPG